MRLRKRYERCLWNQTKTYGRWYEKPAPWLPWLPCAASRSKARRRFDVKRFAHVMLFTSCEVCSLRFAECCGKSGQKQRGNAQKCGSAESVEGNVFRQCNL